MTMKKSEVVGEVLVTVNTGFMRKQMLHKSKEGPVDGHFRTLVGQLLDGEGLDIDENDTDNWLEIVAALALQAASYIKPDTSKGGGMDPGGYVKVKCITTGQRSERYELWILVLFMFVHVD